MFQTFGTRLGNLRTARGMPSKQLASLAGLDPSYITQLERGRRDPPRHAVILKLALALDLPQREAQQLSRAATNERLLRAISNMENRVPAMELAEELIHHEDALDEAGYLAIKSFMHAYIAGRTAQLTNIGQTTPNNGSVDREEMLATTPEEAM